MVCVDLDVGAEVLHHAAVVHHRVPVVGDAEGRADLHLHLALPQQHLHQEVQLEAHLLLPQAEEEGESCCISFTQC